MRRARGVAGQSWAICSTSRVGVVRTRPLSTAQIVIASRSCSTPLIAAGGRINFGSEHLPPTSSLAWIQRASYAKSSKGGKGKKDDDDGPAVSVSELMAQTKDSLTSQMKRSVDWLTEEFAKLRVGRANTEILNRIKVEGAPLAKKGSVYVKDSFTLAITPFEKEQTKKIVEALRDADMDLNPQTDGDNIIVRLPKATDEYRQSLLKQATKMNEEVKNSIRRARQGALTDLKKHKDAISKDDMKKLENEVQKITDEYNKKAEQLHKAKEQAITGAGN